MPIDESKQKNLWGLSSDNGAGLEPQRADLWYVDMTEVVNGLNRQNIFNQLSLPAVNEMEPQLAQSVTIPEIRTKAEPIRRDSIPFPMPAWDDPLDAIKLVFLVDTYSNANSSKVLALLQAWQALVRAGRGNRSDLYGTASIQGQRTPQIYLNAEFQIDYAFPLRIVFLRGSLITTDAISAEQSAVLSALSSRWRVTSSRPMTLKAALNIAADWRFKDVWLGGWKMSDVAYAETKLQTVDVTLYAASFDQVI